LRFKCICARFVASALILNQAAFTLVLFHTSSRDSVEKGPPMLTPIIMLVLMIAPYVFTCLLATITVRTFDGRNAAAIGVGILFIFTGIGHFVQTEPMAQMLPSWVPERVLLVYLSGMLEFAIALGLFMPRFRPLAGRCAAAVLILFFPANIYAALNQVPMGGHAWGLSYLWIRAPLQLTILIWAYWFIIRQPATQHGRNAALGT
jgi:uncharacterized membrane protein